MSATTNTNRTPKLVLKTSRTTTPVIATAPTFAPSTTATGSFYLPTIKQKNHRKGGRNHKKHLRKPPSFDTYLHSPISPTITPRGYLARPPSLSSSYSSTSSLTDNEDLMYGYGKTLSMPPRLRRGSSATYKVRFAEVSDDGSSIASSCTDDAEDWDVNDLEEDDEEEFILVPPFVPPPRHFSYHKKNVTT